MIQFYLGLVLIAVAAIIGFYGTQLAREGWAKGKNQPEQQVEQVSRLSGEINALGKRIEKLGDAFTQNAAIDSKIQLDILKDDHDRLAERKNDLSKAERQALEEQAITLESLERGRKRSTEVAELDKRQRENAERQAQIKRDAAAQEEQQLRSERILPSCRYAVIKLYEMLRTVANLCDLQIESDFLEKPSLEGSRLVKDGVLTPGENVIRLGTDKEWEFHVRFLPRRPTSQPGRPDWATDEPTFEIQAGRSRLAIRDYRPSGTMPRPPGLLTLFEAGPENRHSEQSSFKEYQGAVDRGLKDLIQDRYNVSPLAEAPPR